MSDASDHSAGLSSLAGSHNFQTDTTNIDSVFAMSGSQFSQGGLSPPKDRYQGPRSTMRASQSVLNQETKYLTKEELTPLDVPNKEFIRALADISKEKEWNVQFDACNLL